MLTLHSVNEYVSAQYRFFLCRMLFPMRRLSSAATPNKKCYLVIVWVNALLIFEIQNYKNCCEWCDFNSRSKKIHLLLAYLILCH